MISRLDVLTLRGWLQDVLGNVLGIPSNGLPANTDQWDGYAADREKLLTHLRTALVGSHLVLGILALRLVAVVGIVLFVAALPPLARRCGGDPGVALWLAALNPLVLIHLVGGAHNDALMVGLLAAGLALAVRHRPAAAVVLVTAAALVKVPAALALVAVAGIWAVQLAGRWRAVRAVAGAGAVAVGTTVLLTALCGTGYGWIAALGTPISPHNWSLTSALGRWTAALGHAGPAAAVELWRWAGVCATLVVAVLVWSYRDRLGPVRGLGVVPACWAR
jgi:alpha-1,6-mannosyltransferase